MCNDAYWMCAFAVLLLVNIFLSLEKTRLFSSFEILPLLQLCHLTAKEAEAQFLLASPSHVEQILGLPKIIYKNVKWNYMSGFILNEIWRYTVRHT